LSCPLRSATKRPVKDGAVHIEKLGHVVAALSGVDQFAGVVNPL